MNQPGIKDFRDLRVYQKAYETSLEVHRETLKYPKQEQYELGSQMRRASKGICANIAEGFGKQNLSTAEFKRFLLMAIGSADEMRVWSRYSLDLGYFNEARWLGWDTSYTEIAKMLNGLHGKWQ
jgi:four helix bundle protein